MKILQRRVIIPHSEAVPRAGEGSAVELADGRILFVYSHFSGMADHDRATLRGGILDPQSGELSEVREFHADPGALNQMSVSLFRFADGELGMLWIRKAECWRDALCLSTSSDDGATWTPPRVITAALSEVCPYWVINNDRVRVLPSGRLLAPVCCYFGAMTEDPANTRPSELAVLISDDRGRNWRMSQRLRIERDNMVRPHRFAPGGEAWFEQQTRGPYTSQEPGIELLADGTLLLYCRTTLGYMYCARSSDHGESFSPLTAVTDLVSPCGPQTIVRAPGGSRLYCLYNDRRSEGYGPQVSWEWRTPLSLAVSDDGGANWRSCGEIEPDTRNYCYMSALFLSSGKLLVTDYESVTIDGSRRNLATLKMQLLEV